MCIYIYALLAAARVACRRFRTGKHMDAKGTGINTGDTITVTCHADYEMSEGGKSRTVVCQSDGQWSAQSQCKRESCCC